MKSNFLYINIFILGLSFGSMFTYLINEYILSHTYYSSVEIFKNYTNYQLINYIAGRWSSAAGEVIINVDLLQQNGNITVINKDKSISKDYKILEIGFVDGFFGYTQLLLCDNTTNCNYNIQINKIFGINNTIVITYPPNISYCNNDLMCSRAFKRIN